MWHDVPGFPNVQVTEDGRVRTTDRTVMVRRKNTLFEVSRKGVELQPYLQDNGYLIVTLWKPGRTGRRPYGVHTLVCRAFHGEPPPNKPMALHDDGNRQRNHKDNLYWGDAQENAGDRGRHGRHARGEKSGSAKLTWEEVNEIRKRYVRGCRQNGSTALAGLYGVSNVSIMDIVSGRTWKQACPDAGNEIFRS